MGLLAAIGIAIIRDFLGHEDVKTMKSMLAQLKRNAREKVADDAPLPKIPSWQQHKFLLDWLHSM
jgi:hypothetical protein